MEDHSLKAQVLRDIMKAMLERDGDRLRPKEAPRVEKGNLSSPDMEKGEGSDDELSEEDAAILGQLWDDGKSGDSHNPEELEDEEDIDEDDKAGR